MSELMLKHEEFIKKNRELQKIVSDEISKAENGETERNVYQLRTILKDLLMMQQHCGVALSYPHMIIDSWDYSDMLGSRLMELASMYERSGKDIDQRKALK